MRLNRLPPSKLDSRKRPDLLKRKKKGDKGNSRRGWQEKSKSAFRERNKRELHVSKLKNKIG